jgi:PAS domain S-box-containing protein
MTSPQENKELVRYYFEELEAGNLGVIDEVFSDEYTTDSTILRSDIEDVGREELKLVLQEMLTAFPDTSIDSQTLFAEGDTVISIQTWCGTHQNEYRGVAPSGNEISYELWGRYVIEDGDIVSASVQGDNFGLFTQLGLQLSIQGYQTLIDTAPDPIVIADAETGQVLETNSATEEIVERPRTEIIGAHQQELHPSEERYDGLFGEAVEQARESPVAVETFEDGTDIELVRADGSRVPVEISAQVVDLADQTALVSIYRDVSERRRREQRTEVLNRILRHNLRNEVTVIAGLAEVLEADLTGEAKERADRIQQTARELSALGEKARIADRITPIGRTQASQVSIRGIVDEVVADISESYPAAEIQTELSDPVTVSTERDAVEIALRETVENAVEHGTSGDTGGTPGDSGESSDVRIELRPAEDEQNVEIIVEDDGPGIPAHELAVLEEGQETALTHGSGIGIWLIHWTTGAIRGDASFENTATGTRVTLSVPSLDSTA